jgi:phosphoribosylformylglycinamidine cyclo-ligase
VSGSSEAEHLSAYAAAGVDIEAGDRAVGLMKEWVAKPPIPPTTSGRRVFATHSFIRPTARSPASMSTPAAA